MGRCHPRSHLKQFLLGLFYFSGASQPTGPDIWCQGTVGRCRCGVCHSYAAHTLDSDMGLAMVDRGANRIGFHARRFLSMHPHHSVEVGAPNGTWPNGIDHLLGHSGGNGANAGVKRSDRIIVYGLARHLLLLGSGLCSLDRCALYVL